MGCTNSTNQHITASPQFKVGDSVTCAFGSGKIEEYRSEDRIYIVKLLNWKLAQGQSPTLYLNEASIFAVPQPTTSNPVAETPATAEVPAQINNDTVKEVEKPTTEEAVSKLAQ